MSVALMSPPGAHPFERLERQAHNGVPAGASSEAPHGSHPHVGREGI